MSSEVANRTRITRIHCTTLVPRVGARRERTADEPACRKPGTTLLTRTTAPAPSEQLIVD